MPTMNASMPAWSVDYSYGFNPAVVRTEAGISSQRRVSHRSSVVASATRRLLGAELPYFEYFIREICEDGRLKFTDKYADYNGLQTGTIRILNGAYSVSTDTRTHIVTCQIEIFR